MKIQAPTPPDRIHVIELLSQNFKDAATAKSFAKELTKLGYKFSKGYIIVELREVRLQCFFNPKEFAYGVIFEKPGVGVWIDFNCRYEPGEPIRSFTASNVDSPMACILDNPQESPGVLLPGKTPKELHRQFIDGRPSAKLRHISADDFPRILEEAWAYLMDWRKARGGPTPQEVARVAAASTANKSRLSGKAPDSLKELFDRLHAVRLEDAHRREPPKSLTGAVMTGDKELVKQFLAAGFDVNERTVGFSSPLNPAAGRGDLEMVDLLLTHGCKASHPDEFLTPMTNAAEIGNVEILERLIEAGADKKKEGPRAFGIAVQKGHAAAARFLLEAGVRPNAEALQNAASGGNVELIKSLLTKGAKTRGAGKALQFAAYSGRLQAVRFLIEAGVNPRKHIEYGTNILGEKCEKPLLPAALARQEGFTLLSTFLDGGKVDEALLIEEADRANEDPFAGFKEAARELEFLEKGARLEGPLREGVIIRILDIIGSGQIGAKVNERNSKGTNLLTMAAENGDIKVVEALLAIGANADANTKDAWTPLHAATSQGHREAVRLLLGAGANSNATNKIGTTPLMLAVKWGDPEIVRTLLAAGADPEPKDSRGQKAIAGVSGLHGKQIGEMLKAAAAARGGTRTDKGQGILCKRTKRMVDLSKARGAQHFKEFFGHPEWAVAAVRAPAESVAREYADIVNARRWEQDVAAKRVLTAERFVFVLQFKLNPWSLVLRSLGWIGSEEIEGMPAEACKLSSRLKARAYSYMAEDTSGCEGYEVFEKGKSLEKAEWGDALQFKSLLRRSKPKDRSLFPDPVFSDEGIYLPACWFEDDGEHVKLGLEGISADAVERVDFVVLKD